MGKCRNVKQGLEPADINDILEKKNLWHDIFFTGFALQGASIYVLNMKLKAFQQFDLYA